MVGGSVIGIPAMAQDSNVILNDINNDVELTQNLFLTNTQASQPAILEGELALGTSANIKWTKLDSAPAEGAPNTISVKLSDTETVYYSYEYIPHGYEEVTTKIDDTLDSENAKNKVFQGISNVAIYNSKDNSNVDITSDFINNTVSVSGYSIDPSYGGAIYNGGTIGNITGDFINNSISVYGYGSGYGGAIYNSSTIRDIIGDFINNSVSGSEPSTGYGGAIYNGGKIGNITGDFINNSSSAYGGAIYNNKATIGNITGDFINNSAALGGAIYNEEGTIRDITGDFINNSGSAIYNSGTIGDITGDFINNSVSLSSSSFAYGGAIYNEGKIDNIRGNFINNTISAVGASIAYGGAIHNRGTIENITGDFINNSVNVPGSNPCIYGGAIDNSGNINNIIGRFVNNNAGAIYNNKRWDNATSKVIGGVINNINGYFSSNNDSAIYNVSKIGNIKGDFVSNTGHIGGAIYTRDLIDKISGNFTLNSASSGGAIYNYGTINNISGDFINNIAQKSGGAICNFGGVIKHISGNFVANEVSGENDVYGGAISLETSYYPDILTIENSSFLDNKVTSKNGKALGGAIYSQNNLNIIANNGISEFTNNYILSNEIKTQQAIFLDKAEVQIQNVYSKAYPIVNLIAKNNGNLVINDKISGAYSNNNIDYTVSSFDVVTYNVLNDSGDSSQTFNYRDTYHWDSTNNRECRNYYVYDENYKEVKSGQYFINKIIDKKNDRITNTIYNILDADGNISYTYSSGTLYDATNNQKLATIKKEGTLNAKIINLFDSDKNIIDTIRYEVEEIKDSQSEKITYVYHVLDENFHEVESFESEQSNILETGHFKLAGYANGYKLNITGDSTGRVILNNNIESVEEDGKLAPVDVSLSNTTLHLGVRDNVLDGNNLTLNSGTFNMGNGTAGVSALNTLTVTGTTNFIADVDLKTKEMDRFSAKDYGTHSGNLNVVGMNLLSDATEGEKVTAIYFAQPGLKNNVTNGTSELPQEKYQNFTAYTPIFKYNVKYDNQNEYDGKGDGGYFLFTKGDKYFRPGGDTGDTGNPSDAFNPSVLSSPVSSVAAAQATVNETFKYVFEHADAFTQLPSMERMAHINANQYALSTDYNQNLGSLATEFNNHAGWFRPYVTFESMNLKNGPKVNATTYGSLFGFDSNFQNLGKGWTGLTTGYIGYNGSQLSYSGVDTTMNGGILGVTQTFYKGNFWTALTASAGASVGQSKTMYGNEDFTSLMAGIGSKTGYNFEFKEGKYILQPIMFLSYTFVNTFDYTNAAGVKINADPAHSIQLNPSVRFIANTKNGWQPYASVGMVWNVMNENNVTANNVRLPEMSMKPYVEYGVGLQKRFKDKYTAFAQAMLRNGGRNGIALTAGFRWNLGKEGRPIEKVMTPSQQKLSYSLTPSPRERAGVRGAHRTGYSATNSLNSGKENGVNISQVSRHSGLDPESINAGYNMVEQMNLTPSPRERAVVRGAHRTGYSATNSLNSGKENGVNISQTPTKLNLLSQADILARANNRITTTTDRKIVKQLTEPQKVTLGGKPQNTTRTTYRATLKQL